MASSTVEPPFDQFLATADAVAEARPDVDAQRVAAVGFCYGGTTVLELARSGADVRAAISYHGILTTHAQAEPGAVRGHVVAFCGAGDPYALIGVDRPGRAAIDWGVYGVPETFVVRGDGVIAYKFIGPLSSESLRDTLMPEIEKALRKG